MSRPPDPSTRAGRAAAERREPRAARTRALLLDEVRRAIDEGSIETLSVSDLCRRAGVNRATFYGHWPDAAAAAVDALTGLVEGIATVDADRIAATSDAPALAGIYEQTLVDQLSLIARDRRSFRQLVDNASFEQTLRSMLEQQVLLAVDALIAAGVEVPGGAEVAASYVAGGVTAASLRWIRSDRTDIDAFARSMVDQLPRWWPRP